MGQRRVIVVAISFIGTIAALVGLSVLFYQTYTPAAHYEIGWAVKLIGCGVMAWKLRANLPSTLIASVLFLAGVHYLGFYVGAAVLGLIRPWP